MKIENGDTLKINGVFFMVTGEGGGRIEIHPLKADEGLKKSKKGSMVVVDVFKNKSK